MGQAMQDKNSFEDHLNLSQINKLIHEPARLAIMANLYVVERSDFIYLMRRTGLTQGNLSAHMSKLENAGYLEINKTFVGKRPHTMIRLTGEGRKAFKKYMAEMKRVFNGLSD